MTDRRLPQWPAHMVQMYGGAPDPLAPYPARPEPFTVPTVTASSVFVATRKATVTARVDASGRLWLRVSIDGVLIAEVESDPRGASLTVDV